nr:transposase [Streptosporangium minutum]
MQTDDTLFPGARQAFQLRCDVGDLDGAWTSKEIVYSITSLPAEAASPARLNHYERAHWGVENRLHWVRDVTFREDHSQLRTGSAPRALASFRNLAISTSAWPIEPTSPTLAVTSSTAMPLSPSTAPDQHAGIGHSELTPGPWPPPQDACLHQRVSGVPDRKGAIHQDHQAANVDIQDISCLLSSLLYTPTENITIRSPNAAPALIDIFGWIYFYLSSSRFMDGSMRPDREPWPVRGHQPSK